MLVNTALRTYDKLAQESGDDLTLQLDLASAYSDVSYIQWNRYYGHLGNQSGAKQSAHKAFAILQKVIETDPRNDRARRSLANNHTILGDLLIGFGETSEALKHYRQALDIREEIVKTDPINESARHALMLSHQRMGDTLGNPRFPNLGDAEGAMRHYREMLRIDDELAREYPTNSAYQHSLSIGYEKMRDMLWSTGNGVGALEIYRKGRDILESLIAGDPNNSRIRRDLAICYSKTGEMLLEMGNVVEALSYHRKAEPLYESLAMLDSTNVRAAGELAGSYNEISAALMKLGQVSEARRYAAKLLKLYQSQSNRSNADAYTLNNLAWALLTIEPSDMRDPVAALPIAKQAVEMTNSSAPDILDTLALAYHLGGNQVRAIETEEKAFALLPTNSPLRHDFEAALAKYKAAAQRQPKR